jgi:hypothetical protein
MISTARSNYPAILQTGDRHVASFGDIILILSQPVFDEKRAITPKWVMGFTSKLHGM